MLIQSPRRSSSKVKQNGGHWPAGACQLGEKKREKLHGRTNGEI